MDCRYSREIGPYLMDDLPAPERRTLEEHLQECASCQREKESLEETLDTLGSLQDVPVPHHFFIPQHGSRLSFAQAWTRLSSLWKIALTAAAALLLTIAGLSASGLRVHVEDGVVTAGFGSLQRPGRSVDEERFRSWSRGLLAQMEQGLAARDQALTQALNRIRLLDRQVQGLDQAQSRRLRSLAAELEHDLSQAWREDDQRALRQAEQWVTQAYTDLHFDYMQRLSVMDANLRQFVERDAVLDEKVSILGEALAHSLDQRQAEKIGE